MSSRGRTKKKWDGQGTSIRHTHLTQQTTSADLNQHTAIVYVTLFALASVWIYCCWWCLPECTYEIAWVGCRCFGCVRAPRARGPPNARARALSPWHRWMVPGWDTTNGADGDGGGVSAARRFGFLSPDRTKERAHSTAKMSRRLLGVFLESGNWLPSLDQCFPYVKAGRAAFRALMLSFPFPYARACCYHRGKMCEMMKKNIDGEHADFRMKAMVIAGVDLNASMKPVVVGLVRRAVPAAGCFQCPRRVLFF